MVNVGTPVFYVDNHLFLSANGVTPTNVGEIYNLSPGSHSVSLPVIGGWYYFAADTGGDNNAGLDYSYIAVFGHNFADLGDNFRFYPEPYITNINSINLHYYSPYSYNGWSLGVFDKTDVEAAIYAGYPGIGSVPSSPSNLEISSVSIGTHYTMPNAPNLSLTMSREYGGTKEFTTHNGSSMSNTMGNSPPKWGDLGAWELGSNPALAKSGRRTWDLKFSYMDDGGLWGSNQMLSNIAESITTGLGYESGDIANSTTFNYNLLTDDSFFSQIWHKTLGGTLPFIFQPDSSNNNPDQFAICRFKDNSLKATQSAFNVYDISLSIEEVW